MLCTFASNWHPIVPDGPPSCAHICDAHALLLRARGCPPDSCDNSGSRRIASRRPSRPCFSCSWSPRNPTVTPNRCLSNSLSVNHYRPGFSVFIGGPRLATNRRSAGNGVKNIISRRAQSLSVSRLLMIMTSFSMVVLDERFSKAMIPQQSGLATEPVPKRTSPMPLLQQTFWVWLRR